jgi:hypothetical protein
MRDFLKRNSPVFFVGFLTFLVFVILIVLRQTKATTTPGLIKVEEKQTEDLGYIKTEEEFGQDPYAQKEAEINELQEQKQSTEEKKNEIPLSERNYVPKIINYTDKGWNPKQTVIHLYQPVIWVNNTNKDIVLEQLTKIYSGLENPIVLKPTKAFKLRFMKTGIFTYQESNSKDFGSIYTLNIDQSQ